MKRLSIAFGLVIAAVALAGTSGIIAAETAVAAYISMVALSATALVVTSRAAPAPVGVVRRRNLPAIATGIVVRAIGGARSVPA